MLPTLVESSDVSNGSWHRLYRNKVYMYHRFINKEEHHSHVQVFLILVDYRKTNTIRCRWLINRKISKQNRLNCKRHDKVQSE